MSSRVSRRSLIAGAGASALGAAVGAGPARAADPTAAPTPADAAFDAALPTITVDVAVIGAGLTGLSAARKLQAAGRSVHVVEADTRVGGRIWTVKADNGTPLNWGATFVGPGQNNVLALAKELGVGTYKTYNTGKNVQAFGSTIKTYSGQIPSVDVISLLEVNSIMTTLNGWAKSIDPAAPWTHSRAVEWDSHTVYSWILDNTTTTNARKLATLLTLSIFSVEMRDLSMLYLLWYIRTAGNLDALLNTAGGAQESQLDGGSARLPEGLAAKVGAANLTLDSPVRRVTQADDGAVTVHSERVLVKARRVLVAVPPPMIPRIIFEPGLSAVKDQLTQRMPMGSVSKAIAVYDKPFWRAKGLTGQATADKGPVKITFDISPGDGSTGVMMGFIDGQDSREFGLTDPAARKAAVLAQFKAWFGAEAATPRQYLDLQWEAQPLHRGCPVAVPAPGALIGFRDALTTVEGKLHFASTETATRWPGYMDGAIQAGETAAATINAAL